jgi:hypothetical protein
MEGTEYSELMGVVIPNEITLAQLVTYFVLPTGIELDVASAFFWYLPRVEDLAEKDKSKWKVEEIPDKIPSGFTLKVKCSSLRDGSDKRLAHCRFGDALCAGSRRNFGTVESPIVRLDESVRSGNGLDN